MDRYQEKANELINKFFNSVDHRHTSRLLAKKLATICVDEIIKSNPFYFYSGRKVTRVSDHSTKDYWKNVKKAIKEA